MRGEEFIRFSIWAVAISPRTKGADMSKEDQMRELLVFIIQTLDSEFNHKVQDKDNPIGLIRHKVDRVLNHSDRSWYGI